MYVDDHNQKVEDPDHNGHDHPHDDAKAASHDDHGHDHSDGDGHDHSDGHDHGHSDDHSHAHSDTDGHGHDDDHGHAEAGHAKQGELSMTEQLQVNMEKHLDVGHLMGHVQDAYYFDCPKALGFSFEDEHGHKHNGIKIPNITGFTKETPMIGTAESPIFVGRLSKFMVLELVAAILLTLVFVWLGKKIQSGDRPKGKIWNLLESFICYIRDEVVKPSVGEHDYLRFLPFLLTTFFFILTLNLLGAIPYLGSATGSLAVTGVLAVVTFVIVTGSGIQKMGFAGFLKAQIPSMDLPPAMKVILLPLMFVIEIFGLFVKHTVLAIRLFANMFAGHLVLAIFVGFIGVLAGTLLFYPFTPVIVLGTIAFSAMELFVAFLQAYVFTFLAALFIGAAQHAH